MLAVTVSTAAALVLLAASAGAGQAASKSGAERAVERHLERVYGVEAGASCDRSRFLRKYTRIWNSPQSLDGSTGRICSRDGRARVTWPKGRYLVQRSVESMECLADPREPGTVARRRDRFHAQPSAR